MKVAVFSLTIFATLAACTPASVDPPSLAVAPPSPDLRPGECTTWLDPATKNTPVAPLYYKLSADGFESARAAGIGQVIVTIPLSSTYDANKGVVHIPTDASQGDSIFFDPTPRSSVNSLGSYTLATDWTIPANAGAGPGENSAGGASGMRASRGARYGVALLDVDPRRGGNWVSARGGMNVPITPDRVRTTEARVSVKIVGHLVQPAILTGKEVHAAAPGAPGEWEMELRYLAISTDCAAIITSRDGEVLKRLR